MHRAKYALFLAFVLLPVAPALSAPTGPAIIPCTDIRGCPDLVTDSTRFPEGTTTVETFSTSSCAVQEGMVDPGTRHLIRFTFNSPNVGAGDLIVGRPSQHPEWFVWSPCHQHYHFREYADYRLWTPLGYLAWDALRQAEPARTSAQTLADHPELLPELVQGRKQGFCVIDIFPASPHTWPVGFVPDLNGGYGSCNAQGISRGWADEYIFLLDGQWIDITDVTPGAYVLEAEVNAEWLYEESDYTNNRAALPVVVGLPGT